MASQQTSGKTGTTFIASAREYLNESTAKFWLDTKFLEWLNAGTLDIISKTHCLETVETEELVEAQLSYALTSPYIAIKSVIYNQGSGDEKALRRGNLQSIGHVRETNIPMFWVPSKDNVIVYPKTDAAHSGTGHDIDVYSITRPVDIVVGGVVLVPSYFDEALVMYMVARALKKDKKPASANVYMSEYNAILDRYRVDFITVPKEPEAVIK